MKISISINPKFLFRLQVYIPMRATYWVDQLQRIKHVHHHGEGHYSMMYYPNTIRYLKQLFGDVLSIEFDEVLYPPRVFKKAVAKSNEKKEVAYPKYAKAIDELEQWIRMKQYSYA